jgi:tetratricopeptide (TPR) repeat protein
MRGLASRGTDPAKAEENLTRAIDLGHAYTIAFEERGATRSALGRHQEAAEDFTAAIAQTPHRPELYFARGVSRLLMHDWQSAEGDFTKTIELGDLRSSTYSQRARARLNQRLYAGAEEDLTRAIEFTADEQDLAALYTARGDLRWEQGRKDEAMDDFGVATRLSRGQASGGRGLLAKLVRFFGRE